MLDVKRAETMKLTFSLTEPGALALIEQFYKDSPSCKRMRNRTRWVLPIVLLPIAFLFILKFGFSLPTVAVFVVATVGWFIFAPSRFDASVRRNAKKMMKESAYAKCFGLSQRPLFRPHRQRLPFEIFHNQKVHPILVPDIMQSADVRMIQAGDGLGLAIEALPQFRIGSEVGGENLDCDCAI